MKCPICGTVQTPDDHRIDLCFDAMSVMIGRASDEVRNELASSIVTLKHGWFASRHEGWGVIAEEWKELQAVIMLNEGPERIWEEAIQLSAMALEMAVQFGDETI